MKTQSIVGLQVQLFDDQRRVLQRHLFSTAGPGSMVGISAPGSPKKSPKVIQTNLLRGFNIRWAPWGLASIRWVPLAAGNLQHDSLCSAWVGDEH